MPLGDAGDYTSFNLTVDLNFLWPVGESFDAGLSAGYSHSFGKEYDTPLGTIEADDIQFLPLAVAGRLDLSEKFALGADVGYAVGINDGNDAGFYYAPRVQFGISQALDLVLAYRGVSRDGGSFDVLTLGLEFGL